MSDPKLYPDARIHEGGETPSPWPKLPPDLIEVILYPADLAATGLTWTPMDRDGDAYRARLEDARWEVCVRGMITCPRTVTARLVIDGTPTYKHETAREAAQLPEMIASALAALHLEELVYTLRRGYVEPPRPPLPEPLLGPFNDALREQLPAALAEQSRVTEALVSLGLALGMTSDALCIDLVELT